LSQTPGVLNRYGRPQCQALGLVTLLCQEVAHRLPSVALLHLDRNRRGQPDAEHPVQGVDCSLSAGALGTECYNGCNHLTVGQQALL